MASSRTSKQTTPPTQGKRPRGRPLDVGKQRRILEVAGQQFLREGYSQVSLDRVAREAKVTKVTIYKHYRTKKDLFHAVITAKCKEFNKFEAYDEYLKLPLHEALQQLGWEFLSLILSREALAMHFAITSESREHPELAKLFWNAGPARLQSEWSRFFSRLAERHHRPGLKDPKLIRHFLSLLQGEFKMRGALGLGEKPSEKELRAHIRECVEILLLLSGKKK